MSEQKEGRKEFDGNIPVLTARGRGIAEAWENSVVEIFNKGAYYVRQGSKDKGRFHYDSTMAITVEKPDDDLFMHKYVRFDFGDLFEYEMEILGAKNSLTHNPKFDPIGDTRWPYQYNDSFTSYPDSRGGRIDQIEGMVEGLCKEPYNRRHQAITWVPERDMGAKDPPCLQSLWAYIAPVGDGVGEVEQYKLNLNARFRSRNVMQAAPMNLRGLHVLQSSIRDAVIERTEMNLVNGRLLDFSDSYHVSANDKPILEGFMRRREKALAGETPVDEKEIEQRAYPIEFVRERYVEVAPLIERKVIDQVTKRALERFGTEAEAVKQWLNKEIEKIKTIAASRKAAIGIE